MPTLCNTHNRIPVIEFLEDRQFMHAQAMSVLSAPAATSGHTSLAEYAPVAVGGVSVAAEPFHEPAATAADTYFSSDSEHAAEATCISASAWAGFAYWSSSALQQLVFPAARGTVIAVRRGGGSRQRHVDPR